MIENYRIGIITDGLYEKIVNGQVLIKNGGVGVYTYQLIRHLLEIDDQNQYFLMRFGEGLLDIYTHSRVQPVFLPVTRLKTFQAGFEFPFFKLARRLNLDVLHYPNQFGGAFLPRSMVRIATLHDLTPLTFPRMHPSVRVWAYRILAGLSLRRCHHVIVDSISVKADLINRQLAKAESISVIPLGVGDGFKRGIRDGDFLRSRGLMDRYMLSVGVLEPRKNHQMLFEVLRRLNERNIEIGLVLLGREGWKWTNPLDLPRYAHLRSKVQIISDVAEDEMIKFYQHATVFVYPSFSEGFGLPILEAMACGVPVIASTAPALLEVGGDAALYADPCSEEEFHHQVARVLDDERLSGDLSVKGVERARAFSWRRTAEATLDVYRSVAKRKGSEHHERGKLGI
jgi:glycosyltransferase involved in cell wall biosynthesis